MSHGKEAGMTARPRSVRVPEEIHSAIDEMAKQTHRDFSSIANEMLDEAVRQK
jgi:predicted transcriptional regulator